MIASVTCTCWERLINGLLIYGENRVRVCYLEYRHYLAREVVDPISWKTRKYSMERREENQINFLHAKMLN